MATTTAIPGTNGNGAGVKRTTMRFTSGITDGGTDVRARVGAVIDESGLSQAAVAREASVSASALSQWLNSQYPGDNEALEEKLIRWMDARGSAAEVRDLVPDEPPFFASRTATELMDQFRYAQALQDMVMAVGIPGIGKSSSAREYARQNPNVWRCELAAHTTGVVPVLKEIAEAVGCGAGSGAAALARSIEAKVRRRQGLLIIDEAHHASPAALDAIRALHDAGGIGIALVGGIELVAKLDRMPQLDSRIGVRQVREVVLIEDVHAQLDAWRVTGRAERALLQKVAKRAGGLRAVSKVLRLATMMARSAGESLAINHFETAAASHSTRMAAA